MVTQLTGHQVCKEITAMRCTPFYAACLALLIAIIVKP